MVSVLLPPTSFWGAWRAPSGSRIVGWQNPGMRECGMGGLIWGFSSSCTGMAARTARGSECTLERDGNNHPSAEKGTGNCESLWRGRFVFWRPPRDLSHPWRCSERSPGSATSPLLLCAPVPAEAAAAQGKDSPASLHSLSIPFHPFWWPCSENLSPAVAWVAEGSGGHFGTSPPFPGGVLAWSRSVLAPKTGSQDKLLFLSQNLGLLRVKRPCQSPGKNCLRTGGSMDALAQDRPSGLSVMFGQLQLGHDRG